MLAGLETHIEKFFSLLRIRGFLIVVCVLLFLTAWNRGIALIYVLLFFLLATLIVCLVVAQLITRKVLVQRFFPPVAYEDKPFTIRYELENQGRFACHLLEVTDSLPFQVETSRNDMLLIETLAGARSIARTVIADWRGVHKPGDIQLASAWPFGLFRSEKTIIADGSAILVYPSTFTLDRLPFEGASNFWHDGSITDHRKGGQDIFIGIREYRRGDNRKNIHWALSAKHSELMVKEYESISRTEICILLDLHTAENPGNGKYAPLEYAIKIAASVAAFALREGYFVSLYGAGKKELVIEAGSGMAWMEKISYALALVQADGHEAYASFVNRELNLHGNHRIFLLFDHRGNSLQPTALGLADDQVMLVRFDPRTFMQMLPEKNRPAKDGSLMIRCGDNLEEKVRSWTTR